MSEQNSPANSLSRASDDALGRRPRNLDEWRAVADWLDAHGFLVHGFDPGFLVSVGGRSFDLPVCAVRLMMRNIADARNEAPRQQVPGSAQCGSVTPETPTP